MHDKVRHICLLLLKEGGKCFKTYGLPKDVRNIIIQSVFKSRVDFRIWDPERLKE